MPDFSIDTINTPDTTLQSVVPTSVIRFEGEPLARGHLQAIDALGSQLNVVLAVGRQPPAGLVIVVGGKAADHLAGLRLLPGGERHEAQAL